jgi:hypothetical protein
MTEVGRDVEYMDGTELAYEVHYAPVETVVYEKPVPIERERVYYEPTSAYDQVVKTKVIDITQSASYASYKSHKVEMERNEHNEFDKL